MKNVWCARVCSGTYAAGGHVEVDFGITSDLSQVSFRDELMMLYGTSHPDETSNLVIGQRIGQLTRFLREIQEWLGLKKGLVRAT